MKAVWLEEFNQKSHWPDVLTLLVYERNFDSVRKRKWMCEFKQKKQNFPSKEGHRRRLFISNNASLNF